MHRSKQLTYQVTFVVGIAVMAVAFLLIKQNVRLTTLPLTSSESGHEIISLPSPLVEDKQTTKPSPDIAAQMVTPVNVVEAVATPVFIENFEKSFSLQEAVSKTKSKDAHWWLSSGAYFTAENGVGSTNIGDLSINDKWRLAFLTSNPIDTNSGFNPQNIFRLVLKDTLKDSAQEAYFKIVNVNLSESKNRNSSNGLLFFNRYQDAFNLYYTGIRVDGYATIKKKVGGKYFTLAYKPMSKTVTPYDRDTNPNQLPKDKWIGMRSEVKTNPDGTVSIKLYTDVGKTGKWTLVAEATDDGVSYGGPVLGEGNGGIRTDFMDVQFDDFSFSAL